MVRQSLLLVVNACDVDGDSVEPEVEELALRLPYPYK
jgi:hypothetical protein